MAANPSNTTVSPFSSFSDPSLCISLRQQLSIFLAPHASQSQQTFSSEQIRRLLIEVFNFREYEVSYQMMKVMGFTKDKWCKLAMEEMVNFIVEEIVGRNISKEGKMNEQQFIEAFTEGVSFLSDFNVNQHKGTLRTIFKELKPQDDTISHKSYFLFLRLYLGSQSPFIQSIPISPPMELSISRELQTPIKSEFGSSSFKDIAHAEIQIKLKEYDREGKGSLVKKQIQDFMYDVLELERNAIGFVIGTFFAKENLILGVSISSLIELICQIHFSQVITTILKKQTRKESPSDIKLPSHLFFSLLQDNCFFFRVAPSKELLLCAFNEIRSISMQLDSNVINLGDMRSWVTEKLCNGRTRKSLSQLGSRGGRSNRVVPPSQSILQAQSSQMEEDQSTVSKDKQKQQMIHQKLSSGTKIMIEAAPLSDIRSERYVAQLQTSNHQFSSQRNIEAQGPFNPNQNKSQAQSSNKTSKPIINIIPAPSTISKHSQGSTLTPSITFKQSLWSKLFGLMGDFTFTDISMLRKHQALQFMKVNLANHQYLKELLTGVEKMFTFQHQQHFQILSSYVIHFCGQSSLRTFNKKAIKGKCSLTDLELAAVLKEAYSWLWSGDFEGLSREMLDQNGKEAMGYKNYLQFVGRNLSVQNTF